MARAIHLARPLLRIEHPLARECMAEFLGVFVLILITNGATAQAVTSLQTKGGYFTMYLGGALAVTVAIYVSGGVSGGHLNPAYTLSMCLLGRFQWRKMPLFVFIQILASFAAAGTAYALYYDAIQQYCNGSLTVTGPRETASIFATYPADYLTLWNGFLDQGPSRVRAEVFYLCAKGTLCANPHRHITVLQRSLSAVVKNHHGFHSRVTVQREKNRPLAIRATCTKMGHVVPLNTLPSADFTAVHFVQQVLCLHVLIKEIITANRHPFIGRFWHVLAKLVGLQVLHCTAFHPRTDGQTEWVNQLLRHICIT
ncbi:aquaporin-10 isoform X3 [Ambystoma mexicanum]|uniref:aquaporin-10 isoform X3 n=1 Tax=Ambystoma mexicanum TaxID=8296 RepID=UPI0037E97752